MLVFTPPGSSRAMGTIAVQEPPHPSMMPVEYRAALALRIQSMVDDLPEATAGELLFQVELEEQFPVIDRISRAGETLVTFSSALQAAAAMPTFPISPLMFKPDPKTEAALQEDNLEEYLALLYPAER
jgi:hypothetical protein